jgi:motility quorum-sensing regulator / GCU-specific mRNA interferase toxin
MEKNTPHYTLSVVQTLVREGKVRMTRSAVAGAAMLGMTGTGIVATVLSLHAQAFRKSMTTYADHRIWQDVYCARTVVGSVYLKLTVVDDVLVVSFKES